MIFLVGCGAAGVWRRELVSLQFVGVIDGVGSGFGNIFWTIFRSGESFISSTRYVAARGISRRSLIFAPWLSGGYNAGFEVTRFGSSRDGRFALVGGSAQLGIIAGFLNVLRLCCYRTHMVLVGVGLLLRCGTRFDAAGTTVVADMIFRDIVTVVL